MMGILPPYFFSFGKKTLAKLNWASPTSFLSEGGRRPGSSSTKHFSGAKLFGGPKHFSEAKLFNFGRSQNGFASQNHFVKHFSKAKLFWGTQNTCFPNRRKKIVKF